jgi:Pyridoxamine 5'-phosphate oxidase
MSLEELQAAIDGSLARATEFTRSLFAANSLDAAQVQALANGSGGMIVATVDRHLKPHAAPVISGCADGVICFSASKGSALLRNINREPAVAFTISQDGHSVMGQGTAIQVALAADLQHMVEPLGRQSKLSALILEPWDGYIYALQISRIFAS